MSIFSQLTMQPAQVELLSELLQGKRKTKNLGYCRRMQGNRRNGQEEIDIVATGEPYTPLRKKQRLRNCILNKSYQFFVDSVFKFLFVQSNFNRECDQMHKN